MKPIKFVVQYLERFFRIVNHALSVQNALNPA